MFAIVYPHESKILACPWSHRVGGNLKHSKQSTTVHEKPFGRQIAIERSVSNNFLSTFVDSINIFDCLLPSVMIEPTNDLGDQPWCTHVYVKKYESRPRGYKTGVQSQTQNKAQWLAACGHVSASNQSLRFILSLRMNSSFITSRPGLPNECSLETGP